MEESGRDVRDEKPLRPFETKKVGQTCFPVASAAAAGICATVKVLLYQKRQIGGHILERSGQGVIGVNVAHRGEYPLHLGVELNVAGQLVRLHLGKLESKPSQTQNRVSPMHSPFLRQVYIIHFKQYQSLLDQEEPI